MSLAQTRSRGLDAIVVTAFQCSLHQHGLRQCRRTTLIKTLWALIVFFGLTFLCANLSLAAVSTFNEEFSGTLLDPSWSLWDGYALHYPGDVANHATFSPTGTHLSISFPGGVEHNQWWLRHAQLSRVFEGSGVYEIKLDSPLDGNQQFGLVFQSAPGTFLMFMLYSHDVVWGYVERFSNVGGVQHRHTIPGESTSGHNTGLVVPAPAPLRLRVILNDDPNPENRNWRFQWSSDGLVWTTVVDGVLEIGEPGQNIGQIQSVGVFAGNQPEAFSTFDARFDYYRTYPLWELPVDGPANLLAAAGDRQIALIWDAVGDAQQYTVYRSLTLGGPYSFLATTTTPGYLDTGLANGTMYAYVVAANVNGVQGLNSTEARGIPHVPDVSATLPVGGRLLALSASELNYVLVNGEKVSQWPDAIGGSLRAVGRFGVEPTFLANAFGGHAAVRFDGQNDYLDLPAEFADFTGGMTLFVVARPTALQAGSKLLLLGNGAGQGNVALGRNGNGAGLQYFTTDSAGGYGWFGTADALTTDEAALYTVVQASGGVNASVLSTVSKNGVVVGSGPVYVPPVVTRSANYIGRSYWGGDGYFAGDLAEIILYNRALSTAELDAVHTYLGQKYGLDVGGVPPPPPLNTPSTIGATAGDGQVSLTWGAVSGASGYKVYRRAITGGAHVQIHEGAGTGHTDVGLANGTTYGYVVKAYDSQHESANSAEVQATPAVATVLVPPAQLPTAGLSLLLDAGNASLTSSNGSEVTLWRDASGANRNAMSPSGHGPTLVSAALGGDAAVRFDGQNDYLDLPAEFADFTGGMTLFVVARPTALQAGSKLLLLGNGAGQGNVALGRNGNGAGLQYFTTDSAGDYGWFGTADALTTDEAALYTVVQASGGVNASVLSTVSKNGVVVGSGPVYVPPVVTRSANYIGRSYWGGDGYFAGDLAEIILYNRALSTAELDAVHTYLGQKYGLDVGGVPPPPPLNTPSTIGATAGDGQVSLTWGAVSGASGYKVYRRAITGGAHVQIHEGAGTGHTDVGLANGTTYGYVVKAYDSQHESANSAEVQATPAVATVLVPPAQLPTAGLSLLLDAGNASLTSSNGSEVTLWRDASGANRNAMSPSGHGPTLVSAALGGDAAVRFDGQNDYLDLPAEFADFTGGMTLFVVARPTALQAGSKLLLLGNGAGQGNVALGRNGNGAGLQYFTTDSAGDYGWFGTADALTTDEAALYTVVQASGGVNASVLSTVSKNGVVVGSGPVYVPPVVTRSANYIGRSYWGGDGYFAGDLAEIILYNRALSTAELDAVHTYLGQKYELPMQ